MVRAMMGKSKIDKNTLLLLHFDGDLKDSSSNNYIITSNASFKQGKFGKAASGSTKIDMPDNIFRNLLISNEFTIEYWYKKGHNALFGWDGGGMLYSAIRIEMARSSGGIYLEYNTGSSHGSYYPFKMDDIDENGIDFIHLALCKKGNNFKIFINGIMRLDITNTSSVLGANRIKNRIDIANTLELFDEFRVSNIARWTSNFTPPTGPY